MKKLFSVFLLVALLAPLGVAYLYLSSQKKIIKRQVKHQIIAGIDRSDLVFLKMSIADSKTKLKWEHAKEFEYKGEMYDIVEKEIEGDSISYWLWWDHKETALNKQLSTLLAGLRQDEKGKQKHRQLFISLLKFNFLETEQTFEVEPYISHSKRFFCPYLLASYHIFQAIPSPPPK